MPLFERHGWQLVILLLALPTQFLLTRYYNAGSTSLERDELLLRVVSDFMTLPWKVLDLNLWRQWFQTVLIYVQDLSGLPNFGSDPVRGESIAHDVLERTGRAVDLFGFAQGKRSPRGKQVKFRVGQVVLHKTFKFRGVIVAWDQQAKAPKQWIEDNYPQDQRDVLVKSPTYRILVDNRDRTGGSQIAYIPQEHLETLMNCKVINTELNDYFEAYDGAQYLPRSWLRQMYPDD